MGQLATWALVLLWAGIVIAVDLSSINFPAGLDLRKIQNLMRIVDPKTCGCARPEQHCEVPVPEARFVGFTCKVGTFCCRMKKRPGRPDLKEIQQLIPSQIQGHLTNLPHGLIPQNTKQPQQESQPQFTRTRIHSSQQQTPQLKGQPQTNQGNFGQRAPNNNQPFYNPNEVNTERKNAVMNEIEPHHLGLPKGVKAFIKPVSQLQHRILIAPVEDQSQPKKDHKICECQAVEECPQENRDYITFRKSCPFGEVQCCRDSEEIAGNEEANHYKSITPKVEIEILSTTSKSYPVEIHQETLSPSPLASLSHIRPVNIPVSLVPKTVEKTESSSASSTYPENHLVDQAFRKKEAVETTPVKNNPVKTFSEAEFSQSITTPPSAVLYSATPYTIVSSSVSIRKIEWETVPANPNKAVNILEENDDSTQVVNKTTTNNTQENIFQVHGMSLNKTDVQPTQTPLPTPQSIYTTRKPIFIPPYRPQPPFREAVVYPNRVQPPLRPVQQIRPNLRQPPPPGPNRVQQQIYRQPIPQNVYPYPRQPIPGSRQPIPANIQAGNLPTSNTNVRQPVSGPILPIRGDPRPQIVPQRPIYPRQPTNQNQPRPPPRPQTTFPNPTPLRPRQPVRQLIRQPINRGDTIQQMYKPREMGFVEAVGDTAIKLVTGLFSWPF